MRCQAATKGKSLPVDAPDQGAMHDARGARHHWSMRGSCFHTRSELFPTLVADRVAARETACVAGDLSGTREHAPSAHAPSGAHDLFPRRIPLIPLNPAESHLKLVFRSDREPAHVDGIHVGGIYVGREETGVGVLCCEIALAGERSEPPGSGMFAAFPNGVESTSFGCRKPGSTGPPTARYFPPATL